MIVLNNGTKKVAHRLSPIPFIYEIQTIFSTVRGYNFLRRKTFNRYTRKEAPMFVVAVLICLLLFAVIFGANWLVSNTNSDELSNMGVERKL